MNDKRKEFYLELIENRLEKMLDQSMCIDQMAHEIFYHVVMKILEEENDLSERLMFAKHDGGH